ncbi:hypothetical protein ACX1DX_10710 [Tessaracoccus sp. Y36]
MLIALLDLALFAPTVSAAAFLVLPLAVEIQVRLLEEPYPRVTQGRAYISDAQTVGWFLPGLGRLIPTDASATKHR